jgi:hypothetical protein
VAVRFRLWWTVESPGIRHNGGNESDTMYVAVDDA